MHFGLESIGDLPPLEEFEERFGALGDTHEQLDLAAEDTGDADPEGGTEVSTEPSTEDHADAANDHEVDEEPAPDAESTGAERTDDTAESAQHDPVIVESEG